MLRFQDALHIASFQFAGSPGDGSQKRSEEPRQTMRVYFGDATQSRLATLDRFHQVTHLRASGKPIHHLDGELPAWIECRDTEVELRRPAEELDRALDGRTYADRPFGRLYPLGLTVLPLKTC
jgi:hypothetical protein